MTLAELNAIDRSAFERALGWIFEDSPWVAERASETRPFTTLDALHDAMTSVVMAASVEEQLALLRAHPDLGAGRREADPPIYHAAQREQAEAGLDALTRDELDRLLKLNASYREKFGFPFVYAVKGSTKHDILNALERRLPSTRDAERQEALRQVYRIARFRLEEMIS
jgi:OHCU decarboxylase